MVTGVLGRRNSRCKGPVARSRGLGGSRNTRGQGSNVLIGRRAGGKNENGEIGRARRHSREGFDLLRKDSREPLAGFELESDINGFVLCSALPGCRTVFYIEPRLPRLLVRLPPFMAGHTALAFSVRQALVCKMGFQPLQVVKKIT